MRKISVIAVLFSLLISIQNPLYSQKAFPEAEGAGAFTVGGRNGSIYHVTNLNKTGPGSLADAVSGSNRIIVFDVSGIIDINQGELEIKGSNLTIAGQTAPGDGIWVKNALTTISGSEIIMRNLRFSHGYWGVSAHHDVINMGKVNHVILDHISAFWGTDETLSPFNKINNITVQYCLMAEGLNYFDPVNTPPLHGFGGIIGSKIEGTITMHHLLWAHFSRRCPRFSGDKKGVNTCLVDYRNNVTFNCSDHTGNNNNKAKVNINFTGCYLKYGPSTPEWLKYSIFQPQKNHIRMYLENNYIWGNPSFTDDNWSSIVWDGDGINHESEIRVDSPFIVPEVLTDPPELAYEKVLESSGALLPSRSINDRRIVNDVMEGTGSVIDYETDLPEAYYNAEFYSIEKPADTDNDGMPDTWEDQFGFDLNDPGDNVTTGAGGYNNVEHYLNNTHPQGETGPVVYIAAYDSRADETRQESGQFYIYRTGSTFSSLTVDYEVSGSAIEGTDFKTLSGFIEIPAGQYKAPLIIDPVADKDSNEENEEVIITLSASEHYFIGCPSASLVVIMHTIGANL
jgi:hypothetical protein